MQGLRWPPLNSGQPDETSLQRLMIRIPLSFGRDSGELLLKRRSLTVVLMLHATCGLFVVVAASLLFADWVIRWVYPNRLNRLRLEPCPSEVFGWNHCTGSMFFTYVYVKPAGS